MKKTVIIERLERINKELEMTPEEFCNYINNNYNTDLKEKDVMSYRTGWVQSEIEWILKN